MDRQSLGSSHARGKRPFSERHAVTLPCTTSTTGTTIKRDNPEQGSNCSQVISRKAHFSRRESGTCVLVAGPSEQLIEDAKDQSAHRRKDARRQRRFAHHAVYLQWERCYAGRGGQSIFPWRHGRQWRDTLYPNYTVRMASYIKQTKNIYPKYT